MFLSILLGLLVLLSLLLNIWQFVAAMRFPLHQRIKDRSFAPPVTLLKPLKGRDEETEKCLRSWFEQDYTGSIELLFGVDSLDDPVCALVDKLIAEYKSPGAQLIVCAEKLGPNSKVSKLAQLVPHAYADFLVVSDADVRVPPDFLTNLVAPFQAGEVGIVCCLYQMAGGPNLPTKWEAVGVNVDFWSQVLQAQTLKPLDFALGAVMAIKRDALTAIGGFPSLVDYLADDFQLGNKIARSGARVVLSSVVVECCEGVKQWSEVWSHQLRWARTIRVSRPAPYFGSILTNALLWPALWVCLEPTSGLALAGLGVCLIFRITSARVLGAKLAGRDYKPGLLLVLMKDLLQVLLWGSAFLGNQVTWRGERFSITPDGKLLKTQIKN